MKHKHHEASVAFTDIDSMLPHRAPFSFVDSVWIDEDDRIHAVRYWKESEPFFMGHFPGYPVVPGVILVETMAQAGGVGVKLQGVVAKGTFFLASIDKVRFRKQVRPGDTFEMVIENLKASPMIVKQAAKGYVNGELAIEASWLCMVGENVVPENIGAGGPID